jgi:hypothetical protein
VFDSFCTEEKGSSDIVKRLISLSLILVLLLTACSRGESETQDTAEPTEAIAQVTPTEASEPTASPTEAPSTATPTQAAEATAVSSASEAPVVEAGEAVCRLESIQELLPLQLQPGIATISSDEWQQGGGQAAPIQIIEYGDFQ